MAWTPVHTWAAQWTAVAAAAGALLGLAYGLGRELHRTRGGRPC